MQELQGVASGLQIYLDGAVDATRELEEKDAVTFQA